MTRRVGLAESTAKALVARPPRLLVIAGATGVGKSTASVGLASRAGFTRLMSTDAIREIMRVSDPEHLDPALHRSSFSKETADILYWTGKKPASLLNRASWRPLTEHVEKGLICLLREFM